MKRILAFLFLFISIAGFSQNLLNTQWQFSVGDSLIWKDENFNSSKWTTIKSGASWESQGFTNYDGFAWYRKSVVIPVELKKDALKFEGLTLYLGTIDDADQVYFNGKLIGESGKLPPNYVSAYDKIRNWNINPKDVHWGKENIIAIRVFDGGGGGGLISQDISLKVGGLDSKVSVKTSFLRENQLFLKNENVSFTFSIENLSKYNVDGQIKYCIINDFKDTILAKSDIVKVAKLKTKQIKIDKGKLSPGFYTLSVDVDSKLVNISKSFNFGVEPEKIVSPADRPADFDNFWMRAKRELGAVDPQFKLIHNDSLSTNKRDVYLVEMRSLGNVLIRGWYARPKAQGKFPAILLLQGYSSNIQLSWGYQGDDMAVFALNVRGHGNSKDNINTGFPGYLQSNIKDKEQYIYRGAYMDCIRAVDFLCSRDEVDSRYIVVEGGSQGGALSFATAALDNKRISLCIPAVPFLSDFPDYFKIAPWPANEFTEFVNKNSSFGWNGVFETLRYFDIKNLAPWIKCPLMMSIGLKDTTCPPHINFAAYNLLTCPKNYYVFPEAGHGLPGEYTKLKYDWMQKELDVLKKTGTKE